MVDTLHGAEFISKHLARESGGKYASALQAYHRGDLDLAVSKAAEAALAEPDNPRLAIELVKLLVLQQRYIQADELLESLPEEVRQHPEIRNLAAHVGFIRASHNAPPVEILERIISDNPDDLERRYQLSAVKMIQDDFGGAMEQLLEIVRRDNTFRRQAGRDGLLAIFSLVGEDDERVQRYRALLNQAMH